MSEALAARLEAVAARLEAVVAKLHGGAGGSHADAKEVPPQLAAYDAFTAQYLDPLVAKCSSPEFIEMVNLPDVGADFAKAFACQRKVVAAAAACKKPSNKELMDLAHDMVQIINKWSAPGPSPYQKALCEAIQLTNWLFYPSPVEVVKTARGYEHFLVQVFLKIKPEQKALHRSFVSQMNELIDHFANYVKEFHKMGLEWNAKGVTLAEFERGAGAAPAAAGVPAAPPAPPVPVAPPAPPAPPVNFAAAAAPAPAAGAGGFAAVFAEINNKGEGGVTTGLKKVTADMKTKNMKDKPVLEAKSSGASGPAAPAAPAAKVKKEPSLHLKQGTWFCENYENQEIAIPDAEMKQSVYIYNATGCVVNIPAKVKSIQIDNCTKTGVVFHSVVSTFEVVNSKGVTVQVLDQCATFTIDKCHGVTIIINEKVAQENPTIISSLSAELNVVLPNSNPDIDPVEAAVPQQFVTSFKDGKLVTEALLHKA